MSDQLQKFMFNAAPVRGEIVSLGNTWHEVLTRRDYPAPVRTVLGEMMAACALLSANLKFNGTLIMQIFGDGPVKMLVVQCGSDLSIRATAKLSDATAATLGEGMSFVDLVNASGHGRCVITLDPADKQPGQQPYQGIVPLNGDDGPLESVAQVLEHYMHHSEQLDTRLWLAANGERAVGMLLQKLPGDGGIVPRRQRARPRYVGARLHAGRHALVAGTARYGTRDGVPPSVLAGKRSPLRTGRDALPVHLLAREGGRDAADAGPRGSGQRDRGTRPCRDSLRLLQPAL